MGFPVSIPPTGASFWMPSLREECFFTLCGQYPGTGFLSTSKSCQSVCHTSWGSTYLLHPQPLTIKATTIISHWGDCSHHCPCPIPLSTYASFKSILKSSSQSEFLKTHAGSCQWPPSVSLPVAVTCPLSTVNSKLTLSKAPTPKTCRFPTCSLSPLPTLSLLSLLHAMVPTSPTQMPLVFQLPHLFLSLQAVPSLVASTALPARAFTRNTRHQRFYTSEHCGPVFI